MRKKQFKAESKKLLDMMINSIYTHKEIFLRELISNSSDALDKRYYHSMADGSGLSRADYKIWLEINKDERTLTVSDNGCGMSAEELENNLGVIAKSGSLDFKTENEKKDDVNIIGQFGVGFYSAFMVSDRVSVVSRKVGEEQANCWTSDGADGFTVEPCEKEQEGTCITLHIKADTEDENYSEFLDCHRLNSLVKKYSDYIRYPIMLDMETSKLKEGSEDEYETVLEPTQLNSMVPLWKKSKNEISKEEYDSFYTENFRDYEAPLKYIHVKTEGQVSYDAILFIPSHTMWDYYSKEYEKGLRLYSNGVMIMDKCADLLPDCFSFVQGLVDCPDLSLNISREMLQHDRQLKIIAKNIEKKIKSELVKLFKDDREAYEKFFDAFGRQIKYSLYSSYGGLTELLGELLMFVSSSDKKKTTLDEYVSRMKEEQKTIYYACGASVEAVEALPQTGFVTDKGFEVLYLTEDVDEFTLQMMRMYKEKTFTNVCADDLDILSDDEKKEMEKENEDAGDLLTCMKEALGESVNSVRLTNKLKNHAACLTSEGALSLEMAKTLSSMPNGNKIEAQTVLEINAAAPVSAKLKEMFAAGDKEKVADYSRILYAEARLLGGLEIEDTAEFCRLVSSLME